MSLEVTKKSSKLDAQATKEKKKHGRCYEWKRLEKKNLWNGWGPQRKKWYIKCKRMMTILSTILENRKKRDENLVAWVTNMENELQESQYDNDFECFDDDQTYDENSNVQHV